MIGRPVAYDQNIFCDLLKINCPKFASAIPNTDTAFRKNFNTVSTLYANLHDWAIGLKYIHQVVERKHFIILT